MDNASLYRNLLPILVIVLLAGIAKTLLKRRGVLPTNVRPRPLMTPIERRTLTYIEMAIPWARVHAQVSLGAILAPQKGLDRSRSTTVRNRFSSKRVDYVVEEKSTGRIVLLIELDDRTHNSRSDAQRDRMTAAAGYSTLRLPAGEKPSVESVRRHIRNVFDAHPDLYMPGRSGTS